MEHEQTSSLSALIQFNESGQLVNDNEIIPLTQDSVLGTSLNLSHHLPPFSQIDFSPSVQRSLSKTLRILSFQANSLTTLSPSLFHFSALVELNLSYNALISLPSSIALLKHLRALYLAGNKMERLNPCIGDLKKLVVLDVSEMRTVTKSVVLPVELLLCKDLKTLYWDQGKRGQEVRQNIVIVPSLKEWCKATVGIQLWERYLTLSNHNSELSSPTKRQKQFTEQTEFTPFDWSSLTLLHRHHLSHFYPNAQHYFELWTGSTHLIDECLNQIVGTCSNCGKPVYKETRVEKIRIMKAWNRERVPVLFQYCYASKCKNSLRK